jgi:hypothetical protein
VIAPVEKELRRHDAPAEREAGPGWPRRSHEVAFSLLVGLAAHGSPVGRLSEAERQELRVGEGGCSTGRLLAVGRGARVDLVGSWVQDRSGSYHLRSAALCVRRGG